MADRRTQQERRQTATTGAELAPRERLKGHVALVTGSDSGIGQATAIAFAREGADVIVTYHEDEEGGRRTLDEVEGAGRRGLLRRLDQRDPAEVRRFFREVVAELGTPTLLVNNAGVGGTGSTIAEMSDDDWAHVLSTDLDGPFYCAREFVGALRRLNEGAAEGQRRRGVIINVTSVHEEIGMKGAGAYNAAKGGLRMLTRTLALELAREGIRVNNLAPGMVLTPMNEEAVEDPEVRRQRERNIPLKRAAQPEEIAAAAVFLASDDASYVHGATLFVDGGLMQMQGQGA